MISRTQLLELGLSRRGIQHRVARGRLHPVQRGVYALGRPQLSRHGRWMAAVLCCGPTAVLSHRSAAALWGIAEEADLIDVSIRTRSYVRRSGIRAHRRASLRAADLDIHRAIPVTAPVTTLVDLATSLTRRRLERAVNEADRLDLIDPERLRRELEAFRGRPGVTPLRELLDRLAFRLTDSELERRFLRLVSDAGLPLPLTRQKVNGFLVDFHWPQLGLVVETDGLRYHRTPSQQTRDQLRDQVHAAVGLATLRFTHAQVRYEPEHVKAILRSVGNRLADPNRSGL